MIDNIINNELIIIINMLANNEDSFLNHFADILTYVKRPVISFQQLNLIFQ